MKKKIYVNYNDFLDFSYDGIKSLDKVISNTLYGFNHAPGFSYLPPNKDKRGYVFFTRPQLNLSKVNIRNDPRLYNLLTEKELSVGRFVRATLDPRLQWGLKPARYNNERVDTRLVDKYNAFIPVLSNALLTLSGIPDEVIPTWTSSSGMRKEQIAMIDGAFDTLDVTDINLSFKNFNGEPITLLLVTWARYASLVFEGVLNPYEDFIVENEFDYHTRIFRFVMDSTGRYITKATGTIAFPFNYPMGKFFDYDINTDYKDVTSTIDVTFKAMGFIHMDDRLLYDFNKVQTYFNPKIEALLNGEKYVGLDIIPHSLLPLLSFKGYPLIDLKTYELIWVIDKKDPFYRKVMKMTDNEIANLLEEIEKRHKKELNKGEEK